MRFYHFRIRISNVAIRSVRSEALHSTSNDVYVKFNFDCYRRVCTQPTRLDAKASSLLYTDNTFEFDYRPKWAEQNDLQTKWLQIKMKEVKQWRFADRVVATADVRLSDIVMGPTEFELPLVNKFEPRWKEKVLGFLSFSVHVEQVCQDLTITMSGIDLDQHETVCVDGREMMLRCEYRDGSHDFHKDMKASYQHAQQWHAVQLRLPVGIGTNALSSSAVHLILYMTQPGAAPVEYGRSIFPLLYCYNSGRPQTDAQEPFLLKHQFSQFVVEQPKFIKCSLQISEGPCYMQMVNGKYNILGVTAGQQYMGFPYTDNLETQYRKSIHHKTDRMYPHLLSFCHAAMKRVVQQDISVEDYVLPPGVSLTERNIRKELIVHCVQIGLPRPLRPGQNSIDLKRRRTLRRTLDLPLPPLSLLSLNTGSDLDSPSILVDAGQPSEVSPLSENMERAGTRTPALSARRQTRQFVLSPRSVEPQAVLPMEERKSKHDWVAKILSQTLAMKQERAYLSIATSQDTLAAKMEKRRQLVQKEATRVRAIKMSKRLMENFSSPRLGRRTLVGPLLLP